MHMPGVLPQPNTGFFALQQPQLLVPAFVRCAPTAVGAVQSMPGHMQPPLAPNVLPGMPPAPQLAAEACVTPTTVPGGFVAGPTSTPSSPQGVRFPMALPLFATTSPGMLPPIQPGSQPPSASLQLSASNVSSLSMTHVPFHAAPPPQAQAVPEPEKCPPDASVSVGVGGASRNGASVRVVDRANHRLLTVPAGDIVNMPRRMAEYVEEATVPADRDPSDVPPRTKLIACSSIVANEPASCKFRRACNYVHADLSRAHANRVHLNLTVAAPQRCRYAVSAHTLHSTPCLPYCCCHMLVAVPTVGAAGAPVGDAPTPSSGFSIQPPILLSSSLSSSKPRCSSELMTSWRFAAC